MTTVDPIAYGQARDAAADRVAFTRQAWHEARTAADIARRAYEDALHTAWECSAEHQAAVIAYDAIR